MFVCLEHIFTFVCLVTTQQRRWELATNIREIFTVPGEGDLDLIYIYLPYKSPIYLAWCLNRFLIVKAFSGQCTVGQSPKGMMVFIYIGHYQGCRVLKCVQGCCRVCPGVLQNVCRDTECVQGAVLTSSLAQQD